MSALERRSVGLLGAIYALRIFGFFLIMPVFALYAHGLSGTTPQLIGLALGMYGGAQVLLQIPYGLASDRFGRKPVIVVGLILFAIGSVVASFAHSIYGVILGRAIQGAGAIPAVLMALAADLTREEQRTKAMAVIGVTIGAAFMLSIVLSPVLNAWIGVPGIFMLTAVFATVALVLVVFAVPTPVREQQRAPRLREVLGVLREPTLASLGAGIFFLHFILTGLFIAFPGLLVAAGLPQARQWELYLPVMVAAVLAMVPFVVIANRRHQTRLALGGAIVTLLLAEGMLLGAHHTLVELTLAAWLFFTGFNFLESALPSLVSRVAPIESRGATLGMYSMLQFLGAFLGGWLGGKMFEHYHADGVFVLALLLLAAWLLLVARMPEPKFMVTRLVRLGQTSPGRAQELARELGALPGVAEAVVIAEEGLAYLKVDPQRFEMRELEAFGVKE